MRIKHDIVKQKDYFLPIAFGVIVNGILGGLFYLFLKVIYLGVVKQNPLVNPVPSAVFFTILWCMSIFYLNWRLQDIYIPIETEVVQHRIIQ